ncbi:mitochondrial uncoupling protein 2-like isoform X4 [Solanum stenotomum]|uniref:mitochondrial uncoupling protein 2-like isoform X4 n=1 Tax=Solanum stenotomum TaxID=172797 RepID=UPI0020CFFF87|nr:mitochondrial uncoupling protein 2-like isoform X4 [Solanum stenotomum]
MALASEISIAGILASSAIAACFAELCTLPLDTAKVRLQLQKRAGEGSGKYRGLLGTVATIAKEEGLLALWKGIVPGLHRQCIYGGLRIGLYEPVKAFFAHTYYVGDGSLFTKVFAALVTGAIAIALANPTDLVKVRLQAEGKAGTPRRYDGAFNAYYTIVKQEGLAALWTGIVPNIARNAIINAAELASYDHLKEVLDSLQFLSVLQLMWDTSPTLCNGCLYLEHVHDNLCLRWVMPDSIKDVYTGWISWQVDKSIGEVWKMIPA